MLEKFSKKFAYLVEKCSISTLYNMDTVSYKRERRNRRICEK